jgi:hypothetical protein
MRTELPIRAVGGNVLLRRVTQDTALILWGRMQTGVVQLGEVVGLGNRWTQRAPWSPPTPQQSKDRNGRLDDGRLDPNWRPMWRYPDSSTPRRPVPVFTHAHEMDLDDLKVGDLVVYNHARVYDHFPFGEFDIFVYPGCWIYGVVTGLHVNDPSVRRYEREAV